NGTVDSIKSLVSSLVEDSINWSSHAVEVVLAPAAVHIPMTQQLLSGHDAFQVGAQNVSRFGAGAFTGEVHAEMLRDFGVKWSLIGHSERRHKFGETFADTAEKIRACQKANIHVIFCIGELLEERNSGKTSEVCAAQLAPVFAAISDWSKVVIAYEPVWAIGTGVVATTEQAQEAHFQVRAEIAAKAGSEIADKVRILYGGSVTPENCAELIACPDVDGFLVGGASLKPSFSDIIKAASVASH
ncbi:isomerase, partial [Perkinsus sp. BL_2016]